MPRLAEGRSDATFDSVLFHVRCQQFPLPLHLGDSGRLDDLLALCIEPIAGEQGAFATQSCNLSTFLMDPVQMASISLKPDYIPPDQAKGWRELLAQACVGAGWILHFPSMDFEAKTPTAAKARRQPSSGDLHIQALNGAWGMMLEDTGVILTP